jgi:hypothetical protein
MSDDDYSPRYRMSFGRKVTGVSILLLTIGFGADACLARMNPPINARQVVTTCQEDDPCWDAETMGNGNVGPKWDCKTMGDHKC